jgi:hypothetical protein
MISGHNRNLRRLSKPYNFPLQSTCSY